MPKKKTTILSDKQYPPELKLKVVLEYIQHPRRQKRICEENEISEELLTTWRQEFLTPRASLNASKKKTELSMTISPIGRNGDFCVGPFCFEIPNIEL